MLKKNENVGVFDSLLFDIIHISLRELHEEDVCTINNMKTCKGCFHVILMLHSSFSFSPVGVPFHFCVCDRNLLSNTDHEFDEVIESMGEHIRSKAWEKGPAMKDGLREIVKKTEFLHLCSPDGNSNPHKDDHVKE